MSEAKYGPAIKHTSALLPALESFDALNQRSSAFAEFARARQPRRPRRSPARHVHRGTGHILDRLPLPPRSRSATGSLRPQTLAAYWDACRHLVIPTLGGYRVSEISVGLLDTTLGDLENSGVSTAQMRSVDLFGDETLKVRPTVHSGFSPDPPLDAVR